MSCFGCWCWGRTISHLSSSALDKVSWWSPATKSFGSQPMPYQHSNDFSSLIQTAPYKALFMRAHPLSKMQATWVNVFRNQTPFIQRQIYLWNIFILVSVIHSRDQKDTEAAVSSEHYQQFNPPSLQCCISGVENNCSSSCYSNFLILDS